MNAFLWVLQVVLAAAFLLSGALKVSQPRAKLATTMGWVDDFSDRTVKIIGALEVLAGIGLVLPALTGIASVLTPVAALGLVILMLGAAATHLRRGETQFVLVNLVLLLLAAIVAWTRFGPYSF